MLADPDKIRTFDGGIESVFAKREFALLTQQGCCLR